MIRKHFIYKTFVKYCFEKEMSSTFIKHFQKTWSQHYHKMHSAFKNCSFVPNVRIDTHGKNIHALIIWINIRSNSEMIFEIEAEQM